MDRYNIALCPSDATFAERCAVYARHHFTPIADGYLIDGVKAHAHVTLCQFEAPADRIDALWRAVQRALAPIFLLTFTGLFFRRGEGIHEKHIWCELSVKRDKTIIDVQRAIAEIIVEQGFPVLTGTGEDYMPHLTLARLRQPAMRMPLLSSELYWPEEGIRSWPVCCDVTLGKSDANGVYLKRIY